MHRSAVVYARVSSKDQEREGFSIPAQPDLLRSYAAGRPLRIAEEFVDVETAKQAGRAAFGQMVAFAKKHRDRPVILVEKTDRLYRNLRDWVTLDELQAEKRALSAWLIADGDMHLKNMALLKIAEPGDRQFRTVRMAPLYDAVTTRVFSKLKHDRLALKLNGKDDNLRRADFQALATTAGLRAGDAEGAVDEVVERLRGALDVIAVPKAIQLSDETRQMTVEVLDLCRRRIEVMA